MEHMLTAVPESQWLARSLRPSPQSRISPRGCHQPL